MVRVLFPSAKYVTKDLQDVGKIPAILYPIDQMRMIDLYYEQYLSKGSNTTIGRVDSLDVISYEGFSQVEKRIGNRRGIRIIELDELRDLGHTISYGIKKTEMTDDDMLIINFADVSVPGINIVPNKDRCFYSTEDISSKWTFFNEKNGCITSCFDKLDVVEEINTNCMFIGLFHIEKPRLLADLIDSVSFNQNQLKMDSFWIAMMEYSKTNPFEMNHVDEWFDIGHIDKYYDMKIAIRSRSFNHITIDRSRGILTKRSDNKEKLINEIKWYLKLPKDVEYSRPRIFSYSLEYENPYVSMEYYAYHTLHELFLFGELQDEQWMNIFRRVRFILNDFRRYSVECDIDFSLNDMYQKKTISRIKRMEKNDGFPCFDDELKINGKNYISINEICRVIEKLTKELLLGVDRFTIIHGDLCFSNILIDSNYSFVKIIDPRGCFGEYDIYGDARYEMAKLMHSIDGKYDYIIKDKYRISGSGNQIDFVIDYDQRANVEDCFFRIFEEEMEKDGYAIKIIESLLFFSMIPLHNESINQQRVMLGTAVELLNSVYCLEIDSGRE